MTILSEAAQLVGERLGDQLEDIAIERVVVGLFFTGVKLSNQSAGLCYTPIKDIPQATCCPSSVGRTFDPVRVQGTSVESVLSGLDSREPIKTAVALAALNGVSATCWAAGLGGGYTIQERVDAQDVVRMPPGTSVAVVGAFVPTLKKLKARGGPWWVIEQDPRTLKFDEMEHYVPADAAEATLSSADVLIVTGVTLVNHTLEGILSLAKPGAEIAVMGPTAGLLPEPLFKRGVRVVGGVWVKQPDQLLDVLAAGGSGYHFFDDLATRIVIENHG